MAIRSTVKAVVLDGERILLTSLLDKQGRPYYGLPGGGQLQHESLQQGLIRECLEETGYTVEPGRFLALYEEIHDDRTVRARFPEYSHKIYHLFLCRLCPEIPRQQPTEQDMFQTGCHWLAVADLPQLRLLPEPLGRALPTLLSSDNPVYLGCQRLTPQGAVVGGVVL